MSSPCEPLRPAEKPAASSEAFANQLLLRWGVVFRDLLARETLAPPWRDLLQVLRRLLFGKPLLLAPLLQLLPHLAHYLLG